MKRRFLLCHFYKVTMKVVKWWVTSSTSVHWHHFTPAVLSTRVELGDKSQQKVSRFFKAISSSPTTTLLNMIFCFSKRLFFLPSFNNRLHFILAVLFPFGKSSPACFLLWDLYFPVASFEQQPEKVQKRDYYNQSGPGKDRGRETARNTVHFLRLWGWYLRESIIPWEDRVSSLSLSPCHPHQSLLRNSVSCWHSNCFIFIFMPDFNTPWLR